MRVAAAALLLGLFACREKQTDSKAVLACMSAQPTRDNYSLTARCVPLGNSERFAGTWFVGFETSLFKVGGAVDGDRLTQYYPLIVPSPLNDAVHKLDAKGHAAYVLVFIGRRSLFQETSEPATLVADKIVSIRRIQVKLPPV